MKRLGLGLFATGLALAGTLAVSCYNPDLSGVNYTCDEANAYCPDGLECIVGACLPPGSLPLVPDGGMPGPPDGSMTVSGCKGQGFVVGMNVFACPGVFNGDTRDQIPAASALCATGFKICGDAKGLDVQACRALGGFFASSVNMRRGGGNSFECGVSNSNPYYAGCGRNARQTVDDVPMMQQCAGFPQAIDCRDDQQWLCDPGSLERTANSVGADGVLCCPM